MIVIIVPPVSGPTDGKIVYAQINYIRKSIFIINMFKKRFKLGTRSLISSKDTKNLMKFLPEPFSGVLSNYG